MRYLRLLSASILVVGISLAACGGATNQGEDCSDTDDPSFDTCPDRFCQLFPDDPRCQDTDPCTNVDKFTDKCATQYCAAHPDDPRCTTDPPGPGPSVLDLLRGFIAHNSEAARAFALEVLGAGLSIPDAVVSQIAAHLNAPEADVRGYFDDGVSLATALLQVGNGAYSTLSKCVLDGTPVCECVNALDLDADIERICGQGAPLASLVVVRTGADDSVKTYELRLDGKTIATATVSPNTVSIVVASRVHIGASVTEDQSEASVVVKDVGDNGHTYATATLSGRGSGAATLDIPQFSTRLLGADVVFSGVIINATLEAGAPGPEVAVGGFSVSVNDYSLSVPPFKGTAEALSLDLSRILITESVTVTGNFPALGVFADVTFSVPAGTKIAFGRSIFASDRQIVVFEDGTATLTAGGVPVNDVTCIRLPSPIDWTFAALNDALCRME